ncbi:MAG TPA: hypothetical protein VEA59_06465 [Patescibacteria group bacterium]|nr:hypothetical protein [Patescibacteria group bacterium]
MAFESLFGEVRQANLIRFNINNDTLAVKAELMSVKEYSGSEIYILGLRSNERISPSKPVIELAKLGVCKCVYLVRRGASKFQECQLIAPCSAEDEREYLDGIAGLASHMLQGMMQDNTVNLPNRYGHFSASSHTRFFAPPFSNLAIASVSALRKLYKYGFPQTYELAVRASQETLQKRGLIA